MEKALEVGGKEAVYAVLFFFCVITTVIIMTRMASKNQDRYLAVMEKLAENTGGIKSSLQNLEKITLCCKESIFNNTNALQLNTAILNKLDRFVSELEVEGDVK